MMQRDKRNHPIFKEFILPKLILSYDNEEKRNKMGVGVDAWYKVDTVLWNEIYLRHTMEIQQSIYRSTVLEREW